MATSTMRIAAGLVLAVSVAACGSAAPASPTPVPPVAPAPAGSSGGGSAPGDPGTVVPPAGGDGALPNPPGTLVTPVAGLLGIHAVGASKLEPAVNGAGIAVRISWVSGVEPCSVLAGVTVARDGNTFRLTVTEGSKGEGMACIEIAMFKAAIVDLGKVEPGTYTISAFGDAPAVTVDVKG